jgi:hypothetical protein
MVRVVVGWAVAKLTIMLEIENVEDPHSDYSMSNMDEELLPEDDFLYVLFKKIAEDFANDLKHDGKFLH